MICQAKQYSDREYCRLCNLGWDVNDPNPPMCNINHIVKRPPDILDNQPFYELMQSYRHCDSMNQFAVSNAYEDVKNFIREHFEVKIGGTGK